MIHRLMSHLEDIVTLINDHRISQLPILAKIKEKSLKEETLTGDFITDELTFQLKGRLRIKHNES